MAWNTIISLVALLLAALPFILSWVSPTKLEVELGNRGKRTVDISKLALNLSYPNDTKKKIQAQTYTKIIAGQDVYEFPMTTVSLANDTTWAAQVTFYPLPSPTEDEEISRHRTRIASSRTSKAQTEPLQAGHFVFADPLVVQPAVESFKRTFDLEKGLYKVSLEAQINGTTRPLKQFAFTLYDFHISTLRTQPEDYRYGVGIYFPPSPLKMVWARLSEDK